MDAADRTNNRRVVAIGLVLVLSMGLSGSAHWPAWHETSTARTLAVAGVALYVACVVAAVWCFVRAGGLRSAHARRHVTDGLVMVGFTLGVIVQSTGPALGWDDGQWAGWLVTSTTMFAWCFAALRARDTGLPNEHGASFVFGSRRVLRGFAWVGIVLSALLFAVNAMFLAT